MKKFELLILFMGLSLFIGSSTSTFTSSQDSPSYDYSASTECKSVPEKALYNGGIVENQAFEIPINTTAFALKNLTVGTIYAFSSWIKITGADSSLIKSQLTIDDTTFNCTGNVLAKNGCWSFLKGGFMIESPLNTNARIYFQNVDGQQIKVSIASASIQPFTPQQWEKDQQHIINTERKRTSILHVSSVDGKRIHGANVFVKQISRDFPFGTVISEFILGNDVYQKWFLERFNAAVFENELKWYFTEPEQGKVNYTIPDLLLQFLRTKQIMIRGHNVVWEEPHLVQPWIKNMTASELRSTVYSRIRSVMTRYQDEFVHWDVNNEMLPNKFFEERLGQNASVEIFQYANKLDPRAGMFMNEYNVLETCDAWCSVDRYVARLRELVESGVSNVGIGLQSHFNVPNPALIRGVIDKLATLRLPIWLTELDLSPKLSEQLQAKYFEVVLREGYSHPSVNGIMLWTGLHSNKEGCYRMCLTDYEFKNLPSGDVFDKLMKEWQTGEIQGKTDERGNFNFSAFLGEYEITVQYGHKITKTRLSLGRGHEGKHSNIII